MNHNSESLRPPFSNIFNLSDLSQAGSEIDLSARGEELHDIARWANVAAIHKFEARITLKRQDRTRFSFEAELVAEIEQNCVVTLEPVFSCIDRTVMRELIYVPHPADQGGELTLAAGDDDVPEAIDNMRYDLAAPLLEELVLSIDPYPRKEGVAFELPSEAKLAPESPFAVLNRLKQGK